MAEDYSSEYSESSFWKKVTAYAITAGKDVIEKSLVLHNCFQDPYTPAKPKSVILGGLSYFILPLDAIPDVTPVVGFSDDLGALALALTVVAANIKEEHRQSAKSKLAEWFGAADGETSI